MDLELNYRDSPPMSFMQMDNATSLQLIAFC
nr:MAG TPA: hypothetical protein [Caudoviricetes sp.]